MKAEYTILLCMLSGVAGILIGVLLSWAFSTKNHVDIEHEQIPKPAYPLMPELPECTHEDVENFDANSAFELTNKIISDILPEELDNVLCKIKREVNAGYTSLHLHYLAWYLYEPLEKKGFKILKEENEYSGASMTIPRYSIIISWGVNTNDND